MKPMLPTFAALLAENATTLCRLWSITRVDGLVHYFTDHDKDVEFDGHVYAATNAFTASAVQSQVNTVGSDMDVQVLLHPDRVSFHDLLAGLYDNAPTELKLVSYKNLEAGSLMLFEGMVSTVDLANPSLGMLKLMGRVQRVMRVLTERYSPGCRAAFGDARCKVNLALYTVPFTVTSAANGQQFTSADLAAQPENRYTLGTVEWTTGRNKGTIQEIATNAIGDFKLLFRTPYMPAPGDKGVVTRGCPQTVAACKGYNNLPNYRGEPYVPGDDGLGL